MSDFLATIIILINRWTAVEMALKYDRVSRLTQISLKFLKIPVLEEIVTSISHNNLWDSHFIVCTSTHN